MAYLDSYVGVRMDDDLGGASDVDFTTGSLIVNLNDHRQYDQGGGIITDIYGDFASHIVTSIVKTDTGDTVDPFLVYMDDLNLAYTSEAQFATMLTVLDYAPDNPDTIYASDDFDVLYGWGGDDSLVGYASDDVIFGDSGNDTVFGGAGADDLYGGTVGSNGVEADYLDGMSGDDTLTGGEGSDTMVGGDGNDLFWDVDAGDVVSAGAGVDTLMSYVSRMLTADQENLVLLGSLNLNGTGNGSVNSIMGNDGGNILSAGLGNDSISGGAGHDTMIGGMGKDLMTGGGGLDRIKYNAATETGTTFATRDVVNTFAHGDKVDVSAVDASILAPGNQAFSFVDHFTHVAGQLQWDQTAPTGYLIQGDTNGDGVADFSLQIYAAPGFGTIHNWDFIL